MYMGQRYEAPGKGDGAQVLFNSLAGPFLWNPAGSDVSYGSTNGGWSGCKGRALLNGADAYTQESSAGKAALNYEENTSLFATFPEELKKAIVKKEVRTYPNHDEVDQNLVTTYDKLWLLSGYELYEPYNGTEEYMNANDSLWGKWLTRDGEAVGYPDNKTTYSRQQLMGLSISYWQAMRGYDENGASRSWWLRTLSNYWTWDDTIYIINENGKVNLGQLFAVGYWGGLAPCFCIGSGN
jgi:hypothetical protein